MEIKNTLIVNLFENEFTKFLVPNTTVLLKLKNSAIKNMVTGGFMITSNPQGWLRSKNFITVDAFDANNALFL